MPEVSYHQQQYIRHQKKRKEAGSFFADLYPSSLSGSVGNLCQNRTDRFFYLQQSDDDLAQFLQYVQRRLCFPSSLSDNYGNAGQFSVRCDSGCRNGSSSVDLSQTCEDHGTLSCSSEQSAEICAGTFTYRMAWCQ